MVVQNAHEEGDKRGLEEEAGERSQHHRPVPESQQLLTDGTGR